MALLHPWSAPWEACLGLEHLFWGEAGRAGAVQQGEAEGGVTKIYT